MTLRTVTLSPGVDHIVTIRPNKNPTEPGTLLSWATQIGGKGNNVARTATAMGIDCIAYSLIGEQNADKVRALFDRETIHAKLIEVPGHTRNNLTQYDPNNTPATHSTGPRLTANQTHIEQLTAQLINDTQPGDLVTFNGAIPERAPTNTWARTAFAIHKRGGTIISDTQEQPLSELLETNLVWMAKPNIHEAKALLPPTQNNQPATLTEEAILAIRSMHQQNVRHPIITLGADGALSTHNNHILHSTLPVKNAKTLVGAGDAFLAGYCAALTPGKWEQHNPIHLALAAAAAHVSNSPTTETVHTIHQYLHQITQTEIATL